MFPRRDRSIKPSGACPHLSHTTLHHDAGVGGEDWERGKELYLHLSLDGLRAAAIERSYPLTAR
jgi:hypothetical protein